MTLMDFYNPLLWISAGVTAFFPLNRYVQRLIQNEENAPRPKTEGRTAHPNASKDKQP